MHFHIPKPLHGWRAFFGEVGIIALGVLIALGFEQLVGQWQWRRQVGTARQALANELVASANQGAERIAVEDCLRDRIGELAVKLNRSSGQWTADPLPAVPGAQVTPHWDNRAMPWVYAVPLRGWSQDAWDTAKSSGALDRMGHDEVASYSAVYGEIARHTRSPKPGAFARIEPVIPRRRASSSTTGRETTRSARLASSMRSMRRSRASAV